MANKKISKIKKIVASKKIKKEIKKVLKSEKKEEVETKKETSFDKSRKLEKLCLLFIIVNRGSALGISKILKENNCSFFTSMFGNGTATKYLDELIGGKYDPSKEIVLAIVTDSLYSQIKPKIESRFSVSEATRGIAFKIDLSKMVSVFSYRYLANVRN